MLLAYTKRVQQFDGAPWSLQKLLHYEEQVTIKGKPSRTRLGLRAAAMWLVLEEMADVQGSLVITPKREELARITGIANTKTISHLLTVLHNAGWIECFNTPKFKDGSQVASFIKIALRRKVSKLPRARSAKKHVLDGQPEGAASGGPAAGAAMQEPRWKKLVDFLKNEGEDELGAVLAQASGFEHPEERKMVVYFKSARLVQAAKKHAKLAAEYIRQFGLAHQEGEITFAVEGRRATADGPDGKPDVGVASTPAQPASPSSEKGSSRTN